MATQDPRTDLIVNAGVNVPIGRLHPEKTPDSQFLGVGRDDLTQAVVRARARLQFQRRKLGQRGGGSLHLYPGQGALRSLVSVLSLSRHPSTSFRQGRERVGSGESWLYSTQNWAKVPMNFSGHA